MYGHTLLFESDMDFLRGEEAAFELLMREMGRGLSGRHDYIDNSNKKSRFSVSFLIVMLFLAGVYLILHGLSIM